MRFLPVALLGLASVAVADVSSWNDLVGDIPQCMKTCLNDFYRDSDIQKKCGDSNDADINCICSVKTSFSNGQNIASDMSSCVQKGCDASDLSDATSKLEDFQNRFSDFAKQCKSDSSSSERKGGSSSGGSSGKGGGGGGGSSGSTSAGNNANDTSSGDDENGARSIAPGFNAMLASGALFLVGAAL